MSAIESPSLEACTFASSNTYVRLLGRRTWLWGLATSALGLLSSRAEATQTLAFDLDELVEHSDSIALVRARSATSQWTHWLGAKRIVTDTVLDVEAHWLGKPLGTHTLVRTLGGEVGDLAQIVHSEAHLEIGQSSLLFMRSHAQRWIPAALGLSQFPLTHDHARLLSGSPRSERLDAIPCRRALLGQPTREVRRRLTNLWDQLGHAPR